MIKEKVVIVLLNVNNKYSSEEIEYKIDELKELVRASGGEVEFSLVQNASSINPKTYIGQGKAEEIRDICENHELDTVIFNHELSGSQMKNLEDIIEKKIVDRTGLILDIFATRAKTKEGKLQVKLAQLEYRLPRLVGYRNYLSREGAGIGTRGPGEQKLEVDRRTVQKEITSIKNKLKDTELKRETKRKRRSDSNIPQVSLVGYSNSGKSTILNALADNFNSKTKQVYSDDLLFATLETSSRNISLPNGKEVIISDTVGFISDLPTKLVESFKSTLEEIRDSDLIVLVNDASNSNYLHQLKASQDVLNEMDLDYKDYLYVFNKVDKNPEFKDYSNYEEEIYISAFNNEDIDRLAKKIEDILFKDYIHLPVKLSYKDYDQYKDLVSLEYKNQEEFKADRVETHLYIHKSKQALYSRYTREDD